jgi:hypothetical protein
VPLCPAPYTLVELLLRACVYVGVPYIQKYACRYIYAVLFGLIPKLDTTAAVHSAELALLIQSLARLTLPSILCYVTQLNVCISLLTFFFLQLKNNEKYRVAKKNACFF